MRLTDKPSDPNVGSGSADLGDDGLIGFIKGLFSDEDEPSKRSGDGVEAGPQGEGFVFGEDPLDDAERMRRELGLPAGYYGGRVPGDLALGRGGVAGHASLVHGEGEFGTKGGPVHGRGRVDVLEAGGQASGSVGVNVARREVYAEGQASGRVSALHAEGEVATDFGGLGQGYGRGSVTVMGASGQAEGRVGVNLKNGTVHAQGRAEAQAAVFHAEGEAHAQFAGGLVQAHGRGEVFVGGRARAEGGVVFDPASGKMAAGVKGDAFVGVSAEAVGTVSGGGVTATGGVRAYAGFGAHFEAGASYDNGKLSLSLDIGASFGIGVGIKGEITIDFPKIADTVVNYVSGAKEIFEIASGLGSLFGGGDKKGGLLGAIVGGGEDRGGDGSAPAPWAGLQRSTFNPLYDPNPLGPSDSDQKKRKPPSIEETRAREKLHHQWSNESEQRTALPSISKKETKDIG
jgi:hypothetical protein